MQLVVTSPPFLDVVQYREDNWLRCWFCDIDMDAVEVTILRKLEDWQAAMTRVFVELERVLVPGGHIAFEVGEVRGGVSISGSILACDSPVDHVHHSPMYCSDCLLRCAPCD